MSNFYKRIELIATICIIIGFIFLAAKGFKRPAETIKEQLLSIISSPEFSGLQDIFNIYKIAQLGVEAIPELQEITKSGPLVERWAAVIALTGLLRENPELEETIMPSLEQTLADDDTIVKMLASAQLLSLGKKQGFPVLIGLLELEEIIGFSQPPEKVNDQALAFLKQFTDQDLKTPQEWQQWWEENKNSLFWNVQENIFQITKDYED